MKKNKVKLVGILCGLLLSGCSPIFYMPTMHHVPLLAAKGEMAASVSSSSYTGNSSTTGGITNAAAAYAITDNIALTAAGTWSNVSDNHAFLAEGGAGYFTPVLKNNHIIAEVYGLVGTGKVFVVPEPQLMRAYIQPAIGFRHRFFEYAFSSRLTFLHASLPSEFRNINTGPVYYNFGVHHGSYTFFEPAATLRLGYKGIKAQLQTAWVFQLNNHKRQISHDNLSINLGLAFALPFNSR